MKTASGFTLIELMVTVAIAAIVLTVGIPSFTETVRSNRMTSQANEFLRALNLARSEAIKRGTTVTITSTSGGTDWKDGWTIAEGGTTIRVQDAQEGDHTFTSSSQDDIQYDSRGFSDLAANETVDLCVASGETGRQIVIAPSGHAYVDGDYTCP